MSPRVLEQSMHPRLQSGASARPLNFTVRSPNKNLVAEDLGSASISTTGHSADAGSMRVASINRASARAGLASIPHGGPALRPTHRSRQYFFDELTGARQIGFAHGRGCPG